MTARFSVEVTPAGTDTSTVGLNGFHPSAFFMK